MATPLDVGEAREAHVRCRDKGADERKAGWDKDAEWLAGSYRESVFGPFQTVEANTYVESAVTIWQRCPVMYCLAVNLNSAVGSFCDLPYLLPGEAHKH